LLSVENVGRLARSRCNQFTTGPESKNPFSVIQIREKAQHSSCQNLLLSDEGLAGVKAWVSGARTFLDF